jgi:putative Holliday junction resolvase
MRVMAVDYGDVRVGVAFSDMTGTLTGDAFTLRSGGDAALAETLVKLAAERQAAQIVVGLPKNMNGTEGERAELCRAFAERLRAGTSIPVALWDERRTTVDAHRILHMSGSRGRKNKEKVDAVAAALILEGYLLSLR